MKSKFTKQQNEVPQSELDAIFAQGEPMTKQATSTTTTASNMGTTGLIQWVKESKTYHQGRCRVNRVYKIMRERRGAGVYPLIAKLLVKEGITYGVPQPTK